MRRTASYKRIVVLAVAAMALLWVWPVAGADRRQALANLQSGIQLAQDGKLDRAIDQLRLAVSQDSTLIRAHQWLGWALSRKGLREEALDAYAQALLIPAQDPVSERAIRSLLAEGFPESMGRDTPLVLPSTRSGLVVAIDDPRLPTQSCGRFQAFYTASDLSPDADHRRVPQYQWPVDRASYGYVLNPQTQRWHLKFRVHWQSPALTEAGKHTDSFAHDVMALLLRLYWVGKAYLGRELKVDLSGITDAWLCQQGSPEAEARRANIYVFSLGTKRDDSEWLREVAHEYGHLIIPGIDHFQEPEAWANGLLGERLFTKWLLINRQSTDRQPSWLQNLKLTQYVQAEIQPLIESFLEQGPQSPLVKDTSKAGMDYYLGLTLYMESAFGPTVLREAIDATYGTATANFLEGCAIALDKRGKSGLPWEMAGPYQMAEHGAGSKNFTYWVYLEEGRWRIQLRFRGGPISGLKLSLDDSTIADEFQVNRRGWHKLALAGREADLKQVRSLLLSSGGGH